MRTPLTRARAILRSRLWTGSLQEARTGLSWREGGSSAIIMMLWKSLEPTNHHHHAVVEADARNGISNLLPFIFVPTGHSTQPPSNQKFRDEKHHRSVDHGEEGTTPSKPEKP
jgi:hypothetical protein